MTSSNHLNNNNCGSDNDGEGSSNSSTSKSSTSNDDAPSAATSSSSSSYDETPHNAALKDEWKRQQNLLKQKLVTEDQFDVDNIKYIGGCDISFFKGNNVDAVASLIVVDLPSMKVVYESYHMV